MSSFQSPVASPRAHDRLWVTDAWLLVTEFQPLQPFEYHRRVGKESLG
jgi:hypothetical protein